MIKPAGSFSITSHGMTAHLMLEYTSLTSAKQQYRLTVEGEKESVLLPFDMNLAASLAKMYIIGLVNGKSSRSEIKVKKPVVRWGTSEDTLFISCALGGHELTRDTEANLFVLTTTSGDFVYESTLRQDALDYLTEINEQFVRKHLE